MPPAENKTHDESAAGCCERYGNTACLEAEHTDDTADKNAESNENDVGRCSLFFGQTHILGCSGNVVGQAYESNHIAAVNDGIGAYGYGDRLLTLDFTDADTMHERLG